MNDTFDKICQDVYKEKQIDISRNDECFKVYKKICKKYLEKYKKHEKTDVEACKHDIQEYSVHYFCKKLHGKPPGKIGDITQYVNKTEPKDESTLPIPTETDKVDLDLQRQLFEKKDKIYRNLFSSDIRKVIFSVSTSQKISGTNIIDIQDKNIADLKNVIGLNLLRASIPISFYNINSSNKAKVTGAAVSGASDGYYNSTDLTDITDIDSYDDKTGKFTFGAATQIAGVTSLDKSIAKILGLVAGASAEGTSTNAADIRGTNFIDIDIEEIPSIVCNNTEYSKNVIARVPVEGYNGEVQNYIANSADIITEYFQPQRMTRLSIRLLDEFGLELDFNGLHSYFTFEAVVLKNVPDMGIVLEN